MFESLSNKIASSLKHIRGNAHITELNVATAIKDIRKALLDADVQYKIAKDFSDTVKERALGEKVIGALHPEQVMVKIMQDELTKLLGGEEKKFNINGSPAIILIAGLQGSGKTTFAAKLAKHVKAQNKNALLIAADVYRPAAIDQLKILGKQIDVDVYAEETEKNVLDIVQRGLAFAQQNNKNLVIIDTAGRLSIDEKLMQEIQSIKKTFKPQETLFVIDAMIGQEAVNTAKIFNEYLDFTGVVLTKLDGDTRGGAALSVTYTVHKPILFVSNGEKLDALEKFYPDRLAQRILGMGDIASLVEKAELHFNEAEAKKLEAKIQKNKFDFEDFKQQIQTIKKMGNMKDMLGMIPGVGSQLKNVDLDDKRFIQIEAIINSMTPHERRNPQVLNASRKARIAKGSGKSANEVNAFIHQFDQMKKMMQQFTKGGMPNMSNMASLSNMMPKGFKL